MYTANSIGVTLKRFAFLYRKAREEKKIAATTFLTILKQALLICCDAGLVNSMGSGERAMEQAINANQSEVAMNLPLSFIMMTPHKDFSPENEGKYAALRMK